MLLISSCKVRHAPPKTVKCITGDDHKFLCSDGERDFILEYEKNFICTPRQDYAAAYDYCSDLRKDLIKCEDNF